MVRTAAIAITIPVTLTNIEDRVYLAGINLTAVFPDSAEEQGVQPDKSIYRGEFNGKYWSFKCINNNLKINACRKICIDPRDPKKLYLCSDYVCFAKSLDSGKAWQVLDEGVIELSAYALAFDEQNDVFYSN